MARPPLEYIYKYINLSMYSIFIPTFFTSSYKGLGDNAYKVDKGLGDNAIFKGLGDSAYKSAV